MNKNSKSKEMTQYAKKGSTKLLMMVLSLSILVAAITVDLVNPVLPLISKDLEASEGEVSWVVSGIALILAIGVPIYGRISDFLELRRLFIIAIMILASGSFLCAMATNLPLLVLGRMVQGAGMSAIPVLSIIVISKVFPQGKRGEALGIIAGSIGIGTAAGPIFGGVIGQYLGWNALFWFTFLLTFIILIGAFYVLPTITPTEIEGNKRKFDLIGGILLGLTVGLFLLGITQGGATGFASFSSFTSFIGSLVALIGFILRIVTIDYPFIPPVLFKNRNYVNSVIVAFFSMFAYFAVIVFVPLLVVDINGLTSGQAGLILLPAGVAVAILSPFVGRLSDRFGDKRLIIIGMSLMMISTLFMSTIASGASPIWVSIGALVAGIAYAFTNSPTNNAAIGFLKADQVGIGAGIFQGALFLGAGTGTGIIGALLSARRDADQSFNPFYMLEAISYSDAFLAATTAGLIALIAGLGIRGNRQHNNKTKKV